MNAAIKHYSWLLVIQFLTVNAFAQSSISLNNQGIITTFVKPVAPIAGAPANTQPTGYPVSVVAAGTPGEFYFSSPDQNRVYKVLANGQLQVVAGSPQGFTGKSGDGGPATSALLTAPSALAVDGAHNLYICDAGNGRIRKIDAAGIITTVPIDVAVPRSLATDSAGNLYIVEAGRYGILKVTPGGGVTTVAGSGTGGFTGDGGSALRAQISPEGLATDSAGNLYFADPINNRVRRVSAGGIINTVAGTGASGFPGHSIRKDLCRSRWPGKYGTGHCQP